MRCPDIRQNLVSFSDSLETVPTGAPYHLENH